MTTSTWKPLALGLFLTLFAVRAAVAEQIVYFNTKSHIYHVHSCPSAHACTKNCIDMPVSKAIAQGGRPCKKCHAKE